jgi:hypothetical protein
MVSGHCSQAYGADYNRPMSRSTTKKKRPAQRDAAADISFKQRPSFSLAAPGAQAAREALSRKVRREVSAARDRHALHPSRWTH